MGILNVTPDSFSDGGEFASVQDAVGHALAMVEEGAGIIDIGGESTRPAGRTYGVGARHISEEEELRRVLPVIEAIRITSDVLISVDTQKASVADAAIEVGATIINDVSAGTADAEMFATAAKRSAPIILMHGHGPGFQLEGIEEYSYDDVVRQVRDYLAERIARAYVAGVREVLADVGIGFAKTYKDNLRLLRHHDEFTQLRVPLVLGVSRKSTIGRAMGGDPQPKERVIGSIAAACYGVLKGAKIIRTHDVKDTREALAVLGAILTS